MIACHLQVLHVIHILNNAENVLNEMNFTLCALLVYNENGSVQTFYITHIFRYSLINGVNITE